MPEPRLSFLPSPRAPPKSCMWLSRCQLLPGTPALASALPPPPFPLWHGGTGLQGGVLAGSPRKGRGTANSWVLSSPPFPRSPRWPAASSSSSSSSSAGSPFTLGSAQQPKEEGRSASGAGCRLTPEERHCAAGRRGSHAKIPEGERAPLHPAASCRQGAERSYPPLAPAPSLPSCNSRSPSCTGGGG